MSAQQQGKQKPRVFISLRYSEAEREAKQIKHALERRNIPTYLCETEVGGEMATEIAEALDVSELAIIMGTKTYGTQTDSLFSTYQEYFMIRTEKKPFFLVKMCEHFELSLTRLIIPSSISYFPWQPGTEMPPDLIDKIVAKLSAVHNSDGANCSAMLSMKSTPSTWRQIVAEEARSRNTAQPNWLFRAARVVASGCRCWFLLVKGQKLVDTDPHKAIPLLEKAVTDWITVSGEISYGAAGCYEILRDACHKAGQKQAAIAYGKDVARVLSLLLGERACPTAQAFEALGYICQDFQDTENAVKYFELAVSRDLPRSQKEKVLRFLSDTYFDKGEYALLVQKQGQLSSLAPRSPLAKVAADLQAYGKICASHGHHEAAKVFFEEVCAMYAYLDDSKHFLESAHLLGQMLLELQDNDDAMFCFNEALEMSLRTVGPHHHTTRRAFEGLAAAYEGCGDYVTARDFLRKSLDAWTQSKDNMDIKVTQLLLKIGSLSSALSDVDAAIDYYERARAALSQISGETSTDIARYSEIIGGLCLEKADYDAAIENYGQAFLIHSATGSDVGRNGKSTAKCHNQLGVVYRLIGEHDTALQHHLQALEIFRACAADNEDDRGTRDTASTMQLLGDCFREMGEHEKAVEQHQNALAAFIASHGEDHEQVAEAMMSLGQDYARIRDFALAVEYQHKAVNKFIDVCGDTQVETGVACASLAQTHSADRDFSTALFYHEQSIETLTAAVGDDHLHVAMAYRSRGDTFVMMRNLDAATADFNRALTIQLQRLSGDHVDVQRTHVRVASFANWNDDDPEPEQPEGAAEDARVFV